MTKACQVFYYTYCMRQVLDNMNASETKLTDLNRMQYLKSLQMLLDASPEHQKKEVAGVIKIVEAFKDPNPEALVMPVY
jgi:hypothetical protein